MTVQTQLAELAGEIRSRARTVHRVKDARRLLSGYADTVTSAAEELAAEAAAEESAVEVAK